jgi:hypothetical protein
MDTFKKWLISELRSKSFFNRLKTNNQNIPPYVAKELWKNVTGTTSDWEGDRKRWEKENPGQDFSKDTFQYLIQTSKMLNEKKWKLENINLHWTILTPKTRKIITDRKFGAINPYQIHAEEERFKQQRIKSSQVAAGENEPVIMFYENGLYDVQEGFHRTMAYLLKGAGDQEVLKKIKIAGSAEIDKIATSFNPVKLRVWVGY